VKKKSKPNKPDVSEQFVLSVMSQTGPISKEKLLYRIGGHLARHMAGMDKKAVTDAVQDGRKRANIVIDKLIKSGAVHKHGDGTLTAMMALRELMIRLVEINFGETIILSSGQSATPTRPALAVNRWQSISAGGEAEGTSIAKAMLKYDKGELAVLMFLDHDLFETNVSDYDNGFWWGFRQTVGDYIWQNSRTIPIRDQKKRIQLEKIAREWATQATAKPQMFTIREAAEYALVDERTIRLWLKQVDQNGNPMLPNFIGSGRKVRIPSTDLDPWRKSRRIRRKKPETPPKD
jgi:hypothetical protein